MDEEIPAWDDFECGAARLGRVFHGDRADRCDAGDLSAAQRRGRADPGAPDPHDGLQRRAARGLALHRGRLHPRRRALPAGHARRGQRHRPRRASRREPPGGDRLLHAPAVRGLLEAAHQRRHRAHRVRRRLPRPGVHAAARRGRRRARAVPFPIRCERPREPAGSSSPPRSSRARPRCSRRRTCGGSRSTSACSTRPASGACTISPSRASAGSPSISGFAFALFAALGYSAQRCERSPKTSRISTTSSG